MKSVLVEAHELVDKGLLDCAQFRELMFTNAVLAHGMGYTDAFAGTVVEEAVAREREAILRSTA
jgi:hypothetical protein